MNNLGKLFNAAAAQGSDLKQTINDWCKTGATPLKDHAERTVGAVDFALTKRDRLVRVTYKTKEEATSAFFALVEVLGEDHRDILSDETRFPVVEFTNGSAIEFDCEETI
jgi:hypothetical protein